MVSQLLTLYITPVIYTYMEGLRAGKAPKVQRKKIVPAVASVR